jgi:hypothetical protein
MLFVFNKFEKKIEGIISICHPYNTGSARRDESDDKRDVQLQALPIFARQARPLPQSVLARPADEPDGVFPVLCQRQQRGGLPGRGSHLTSADGPADAAPQEVAPHHTTRLALRRTLYLSRSSASSRLGSLTQMKINCTQRNAHSVIKKNAIYALFGVWCFKRQTVLFRTASKIGMKKKKLGWRSFIL